MTYHRPTLARLSRMKSLVHEQPTRTLQKSRDIGSVAANTLRKAHTTGIAFQRTKTEPQREGNSHNHTSGEYTQRTDRTPGYAIDMPHHASRVTSQGTRSSVQTDVKGHGYISRDHSQSTLNAPQRGTNKQYYALDMQPPRAMAKTQSSRHMHTNSLRSTLNAGTRSRANPTLVHRQRSVDVQGKGMGEEMATSTSIYRAAIKNPRTHASARATSSAEKSTQTDTYARVNNEGGVPPSDGYAKQLQAEVEVCAVRLLSKSQSTGIRTTRKDVECEIDSAAFKTWGEQYATQNTLMGRALRRGTDRDTYILTQRQAHLTRTRTHHRETWRAIDVGSPTATSGEQTEAKAQEARTQPSRHTHTLRKTLSQPSQHTATHRDSHEYTRTLQARRMRSVPHFAETGDKYTHKRTTDSDPDTLCSGAGPGGAGGRRRSNYIYSRGGCATNSRGSSPTKIQRIGGASTGLNTSNAREGLDGAGVNSNNRTGSCTSDSERWRMILETGAKGYSIAKTYPTTFKSHSTIAEPYSITANTYSTTRNTYSTTGNTYSTAKPVRPATQVQRAKSLTDKRKSIDTSNQGQPESLPRKRAATAMHTMLQSNGRELSFKSQSKASKSGPGESKTKEKTKHRLSISERALKPRESMRPADTLGAAPPSVHPGPTMRRCG
ncbi:hypothetical protein SARC_10146 [Sphaeroforma arctica JP610]|uniref:Uncharacterized protein n=1 Tax=Sphaeroforma arctica JP610 TaxID=667725 RepID=A0A0L0FMW4_9EUKA|nr:hypothetical protein SARC_10146 [Sphaeroforma arctica JP610]KNC77388.1 hypothetical protein SARC_10146 [Sphaeroforma arctica JP610]|eukprot:XP_014151290.1 hypothetical protein SARC_10146 [Sphaeroforma arctica JP610]